MIDQIINIVYGLLMVLLIVGTVQEWRKTKRHVQLLPIVAYVLSLLAFVGPIRAGVMSPWIAAFAWLAVGLVVRVMVRRRSK